MRDRSFFRSTGGAAGAARGAGDGAGERRDDRSGRAEEAKLEVIGATGQVVRTFEPAEEPEERVRWSRPALPVGTGIAQARRDLWPDPAATLPDAGSGSDPSARRAGEVRGRLLVISSRRTRRSGTGSGGRIWTRDAGALASKARGRPRKRGRPTGSSG